jgi:hypothetical protein
MVEIGDGLKTNVVGFSDVAAKVRVSNRAEPFRL